MTDTTEVAATEPAAAASAPRGALSAMRLPELQAMAAELGISGTARMRKSDLLEAIRAARGDGTGAPSVRAPRTSRRASAPAGPPQGEAAPTPDIPAEAANGAAAQSVALTPSPQQPAEQRAAHNGADQQQPGDQQQSADRQQPVDQQPVDQQPGDQQPVDQQPVDQQPGERDQSTGGQQGSNRQGGNQQGGNQQGGNQQGGNQQGGNQQRERGERRDRPQQDRPQQDRPQQDRPQQGQHHDDDEDGEGRGRRRRGRYRDRKRRTRGPEGAPGVAVAPGEEVEVGEDDVLIPVAGIVDVLDNYAFLRTSGYLPGPNDVYVSLGQVKKHGLRKGDAVRGAVRQQREGDQNANNQRAKFNALVRIDEVNGASSDEARNRPEFGKLTPLYPQERLRLETDSNITTTRIIDLVAPIGKGQRGLIVSPPKAGKTLVLQAIANAITRNNPECHLMVVLVDERPEEVTDMQRTVKGEVIASTFDRPADDHTTVAELAIERAKRLVELGHDVVVLLDSITRLGRAYNLAAPASGRILSGGVDSSALYPPKRFFGAARNIENGGSLTILATALVETGSKMDEVIFEEFKGTGNMELRLSRQLADKRIFPAVDVNASGTRREEILMARDELAVVWKLRRVMGALDPQQAIELLLDRVKGTRSNVEFLMQVQKTTPTPGRDRDDD